MEDDLYRTCPCGNIESCYWYASTVCWDGIVLECQCICSVDVVELNTHGCLYAYSGVITEKYYISCHNVRKSEILAYFIRIICNTSKIADISTLHLKLFGYNSINSHYSQIRCIDDSIGEGYSHLSLPLVEMNLQLDALTAEE